MLSTDIPLYTVPFARAEIRCGDRPCTDMQNFKKIRIDLLVPKTLFPGVGNKKTEQIDLNTLYSLIEQAKNVLGEDAYPSFTYFEHVSSVSNSVCSGFAKTYYYGFLVYSDNEQEPIAFSDMILYPQLRLAYLPYIFVKPDYQGMSLGSLLLRLHSLILETPAATYKTPFVSVYNESANVWSEFTDAPRQVSKDGTVTLLSCDTEVITILQKRLSYVQGKFIPYTIFLHVKRTNTKAQAFYEKHQFTPVYVIPNLFQTTDGVVYCKTNAESTHVESMLRLYTEQQHKTDIRVSHKNRVTVKTTDAETRIRSALYLETGDAKPIVIESTITQESIARYLPHLKCEYKWTTYQSPAIKPYTHFLQSLESKMENKVLQGKVEVQLSPRMWYKHKNLYWLGLDFDAKHYNNDLEQSYQDTRKLVRKLIVLGLKTYVTFTGGGFHVLVLHLLDLDDTEYAFQNIRLAYKQTIQSEYPTLDVISSFRITPFRGPGTMHPRGVFLYPYRATEFMRKQLDAIIEESKVVPSELPETKRREIALKIIDSWTVKSVITDLNSIKRIFEAFGI